MFGLPRAFLGFCCGGLVSVEEVGLLKIFGAENLADFGGPFPSGPVLEVELHEFLRAFDGFLFGLQIEDGETAECWRLLGPSLP
jgi:hypothetical protein